MLKAVFLLKRMFLRVLNEKYQLKQIPKPKSVKLGIGRLGFGIFNL